MDDRFLGDASVDAHHAFRTMLVGRSTQIEPPEGTHEKRVFKIRAAESLRERSSANLLLDKMYATRGYHSTPIPAEDCPHRKTFLASDHNTTIGTLTIGLDSPDTLLADNLFSAEVISLRNSGLQVCEFTKLAMDRRARSPRLLAAMFHVAYIYAHRVKALDKLLIEVNPRHVKYYETMLGFNVIGTERHNTRVNAPAVLLSLDLCYAQEQITIFGGRPEMSSTERSVYPHFFSVQDEDGIVGRLLRTNEDIAHVHEISARTTVISEVATEMH